jgi:large repetitive protein
LDHIVVTPHDSTIPVGGSQTYTVEGFDVYGNSRGDLTSGTTFTITPDGSCTANVCTASIAGLHSVKAQRGKTDTATLHVGGATPVIGSFSPAAAKVGVPVVITGSGFAGATDVAFNGTAATFVIDSDTQITTSVPNGALTGKISVAGPGGTALSSGTFKVQPSITSFSPASGPVGTTVVVTGSAFTGATAVSFNGIAAVFTVDSYSQITATVPCCDASGKIKVTTPGGNVSSATAFKVPASISSFTPGSGPVGTSVVITGVAFTGALAVAFNGVGATFTVDSDTQITAVVPAGATTGKIKVTTGGGPASSATNFQVTP